MSGQLNSSGVISHFADIVGGKLTSMNLGWQPVFALLNGAYFVLHYMFASQTAHVGALYTAFLAMMLSAGDASSCPPQSAFTALQSIFNPSCDASKFHPRQLPSSQCTHTTANDANGASEPRSSEQRGYHALDDSQHVPNPPLKSANGAATHRKAMSIQGQ